MALTFEIFNEFLRKKLSNNVDPIDPELYERKLVLEGMLNRGLYRPFDLSARLQRKIQRKMKYPPKKALQKYLLEIFNLFIENGIKRGPGNLIISNLPKKAIDVDGNECELTPEILYNSLTYVKIPIEFIDQIDDGVFVVKCPTKEDAKEAAERLNKKLFSGNVISASYNEIKKVELKEIAVMVVNNRCNMLPPLMFLALFLFVWVKAWGFLWN